MGKAVKATQSLLLLLAGLASFYLAARWHEPPGGLPGENADVVAAGSPIQRATQEEGPAGLPPERDASLALPRRDRLVPESSGDAFLAHSWLPPVVAPSPPATAPAPQPAAPTVPPLPFSFVGLLEAGAATPRAFLSKGDALLVVAAGDTLDKNSYRVDSISNEQIVITYLPMNRQQTLTVAGAAP